MFSQSDYTVILTSNFEYVSVASWDPHILWDPEPQAQ